MIVNGKDYKVSVLVLFLKNELNVTIKTIETLLIDIEDGVYISILLNGDSCNRLRNICNNHSNIHYYESNINLGVAGGRNFLISKDSCKSSDVILILDNDVIPPENYVRELVSFLDEHDDAGVVGAISADLTAIKPETLHYFKSKGVWGGSIWKIKSTEIRDIVYTDIKSNCIYHMGMHKDYAYAYFSIKPLIHRLLKYFHGNAFNQLLYHYPVLKYDQKLLNAIVSGKKDFHVSNVPGCSQAFRRSLVNEVGTLNDCFNPYGFEDSDFCIRAIKAGYTNYITNRIWLFHGTDSRHDNRDYDKYYRMIFRGITILSYLHLTTPRFLFFIFVNLPFRAFYIISSHKTGGRLHLSKSIISGVNSGIFALFSTKNTIQK